MSRHSKSGQKAEREYEAMFDREEKGDDDGDPTVARYKELMKEQKAKQSQSTQSSK